MRVSASSFLGSLSGAVLFGLGLWALGGCDTVPAPERNQQPPSVAGLQVVPDSINQSDLPPDQVGDSSAVVPLVIDSVRATDPDGSVARVAFVLEPSSNPRGAISGSLPPAEPPLYGGQLSLSIPLVDEIYTVRVFAVDDDSLASNQVTGQFRFVASDSSATPSTPKRAEGLRMSAPPGRFPPLK